MNEPRVECFEGGNCNLAANSYSQLKAAQFALLNCSVDWAVERRPVDGRSVWVALTGLARGESCQCENRITDHSLNTQLDDQ